MDIGTALVAFSGLGCVTGIVCMAIDKFSGARQRAVESARQLDQERVALLQQRVVELEHVNNQLQQQLDWHTRLLEAPSTASLPAREPAGISRSERR